jgi:hypothetical protein
MELQALLTVPQTRDPQESALQWHLLSVPQV